MSDMGVIIHLVAKAESGAELERRLRELGFDNVRTLAGAKKVLITADAHELSDRLGLVLRYERREKVVGTRRLPSSYPVIADSSELPSHIAELVEHCYTPIPPDRFGKSRES